MEGRRRIARVWEKNNFDKRKAQRQAVAEQHKLGWHALAQAIVCTAIDDIRTCSKSDIMRWERNNIDYDPEEYKTKCKKTKRLNYYDAKHFLLGRRVTGITGLDGKEIFKMLMKEKGLEYDGERIFIKIQADNK